VGEADGVQRGHALSEVPRSLGSASRSARAQRERRPLCHFAFARQEVLDPGRKLPIGEQAQDQIENIEGQIRGVVVSSEPFDQMTAHLDSLTEQLVGVVQGEVQRAGTTAYNSHHRQVDEHDS